ncbi:MAG: insulinase family protein [Firmicutes bacterium]|nr:insulinase family protein [Bacillota bacterium]
MTMRSKRYENIGETLYFETLENGLQIRVLPRPGYQKSMALLAVHYGAADRRFQAGGQWVDSPAGVAHFLEHKMFDLPDGGNAEALLNAHGAEGNAFTGAGVTAYHFSCTEDFEACLRILLGYVSAPYFTPESVQKEQGIIGQEFQMYEDDPDHRLYYGLMGCLFSHHPIRENIVGSIESIAQITDKTLYDCHKVFYNPSNMALCVMGDTEPEKIAEIAREILPTAPGEVPKRDYGSAEPPCPEQKRIERVMEVSAPLFAFGARYFPAADTLKERLTAELSMDCLTARSSPFYTRLYAEGLLNTNFSAFADFSAGTAALMCMGESQNPDAVLDTFCEAARRAGTDGFDPALFERVRRAFYGERLRNLGSFQSSCAGLAEGCFHGFEPLEGFAVLGCVTNDDVRNFIRQKLSPENLAISIVYPNTQEAENWHG